MEPEPNADIIEPGTAPDEESHPEPIDDEIARNRPERTEKEKAEFALKKNADRFKELGGDPAKVLAPEIEAPAPTDEVPEWYKKEKAKEGQQTALQLAEAITDPKERELVTVYLKTRIVPSGDPHEDLRFALLATNASKNAQIVEEVGRATKPRTSGNAPGAPANPVTPETEFVPTANERSLMGPPFNMSKEQVLAARKAEEGRNKVESA
jgi:hypothetical protein